MKRLIFKQPVTIMLTMAFSLILLGTGACKKDDFEEDFYGKEDSVAHIDPVTDFVHPGILHSQEDLDRIKDYVNGNVYPPMGSYLILQSQNTASSAYQVQGPFENIARDGVDANTKGPSEQDFNAAYQNALMWVITGDESHAQKSIEILNAYATTLKGITGSNDNALTASLAPFILANAAEIMRYTYPKWSDEDIAQCEAMFRNVFVKELNTFWEKPAYTNGNWGIAATKAMMAFGVFLDDPDIFNDAVEFFYDQGRDNGSLADYISETGQCQESGRDQGHTMLGLGCLAEVCEVGYQQGLDMYGALENRLMAGYEYTAKYNLGYEVPFEQWTDITGKYSNWSTISEEGRGEFRSVFEIAYNAYVNRKGLEMPWTKEAISRISPEGKPFGSDHPGFGTLLFFTGDPVEAPEGRGFWDYQFNTDGKTEGWSMVQEGATSRVEAGMLKVSMANAGTPEAPKYRADLKIANVMLDPMEYPVWAIRFNKPGNSKLTLDTKLGSFSEEGTVISASGETDVYYWDLTEKFSQITPLEYLNLKVADMTTGDPSYEVDWVMTFKSIEELNAYLK